MKAFHGAVPAPTRSTYSVAPATSEEFNRLRLPLRPVACVRFDDVLFLRGTSCPAPDARVAFAALAEHLREWPGAKLSIFGHDDSSAGRHARPLAARRARAIVATLLGRCDVWLELAQKPVFTDHWADAQASVHMFDNLFGQGEPVPATIPEVQEPAFFSLAQHYLDWLRRADDLTPVLTQLTPDRLLSADGRGGTQSCGAFNPLLVLEAGHPQGEADQPSLLHATNQNRRVMVYVFPADAAISSERWPCPRDSDGDTGCRARLWSDADARALPHAAPRLHQHGDRTFGCRFYERLSEGSPAELLGPTRPRFKLAATIRSNSGAAPLKNTRYRVLLPGGMTVTGTTDHDGMMTLLDVPAGAHPITIDGYEILVPTAPHDAAPSIVRIEGYRVDVTLPDAEHDS